LPFYINLITSISEKIHIIGHSNFIFYLSINNDNHLFFINFLICVFITIICVLLRYIYKLLIIIICYMEDNKKICYGVKK